MTVAIYLTAIVAANLIVTAMGPSVSIVTAFVLIGLDLSLRDHLHDKWQDRLVIKMGALIVAGSVLSWLINRDAATIALASALAFGAAASVDGIVYHLARRWSWFARANSSNVFGAAVDSLVFPTVAFGGVLWSITAGQFVAKVAGGLLWATVIYGVRRRQEATA